MHRVYAVNAWLLRRHHSCSWRMATGLSAFNLRLIKRLRLYSYTEISCNQNVNSEKRALHNALIMMHILPEQRRCAMN